MQLILWPPTPVSVSVPPLQFELDGVQTNVALDTVNPNNNQPLPSGVYFKKDGVNVAVSIDTVTPANNVLLPVELSSLAGPITVNAGDLSVSISSTNDSTAVGDGVTGDLANVRTNGVTGLNELKVADDDARASLLSIDTSAGQLVDSQGEAGTAATPTGFFALGTDGTLATSLKTNAAGQLEVVGISSALPTGAATLAEQQTQTGHLSEIEGAVETLETTVNLDGNPAGAAGLMIGGKDSLGDFQQVAVNAAGELSVTFGTAAFATETTLSALNNKVANDYGSSVGAVRTAAQLGNATGVADFGVGVDGAQTLRVSANLKRNGNELSYNTGAADANTPRAVLATRHEAAATPLSVQISNGTSFVSTSSVNGANQKIVNTNGTTLKTAAFALGFSTATSDHREIAVNSLGELLTAGEAVLGESNVTATGSLVAPVGARGFVIQNSARAQGALRFSSGVASATAGFLLEPGQSTSYIRGRIALLDFFAVDALPFDACVIWFG